jgi:hypothetical protein
MNPQFDASLDFYAWSQHTQDFLQSHFLNNKDLLTRMITDAIKNPDLRSKCETHFLLDYLVIYCDKYDNRIRLHLSTSEHLTRIHDHRFDFSTLVLTGGYKHIFYTPKIDLYAQSPDDHAILFQSAQNPDNSFADLSVDDFDISCIRDESRLSTYSISHHVAHSVLTKKDTLSVIIRSPAKKQRSFIFDTQNNSLWWRFGRSYETEQRISSKIMTDEKLQSALDTLYELGMIERVTI